LGFALQRSEPIDTAIRRVLDEVLHEAVSGLRGGADPHAAVHDARKASKRVRAVARLLRPSVGSRTFRKLNTRARDAARLLAPDRDARVVQRAFDDLVATANDPAVYEALRGRVAVPAPPPDPQRLAAAAEALDALRSHTQRLRIDDRGWAAVGPGLEAVYRKGARALTAAAGKTSATRLHEWRKEAKYLWHATQLLTPAWPAVLEPLAEQIHALSDLLGDDHDLEVMAAVTAAAGHPTPSGWAELVEHRHDELRAAAFSLGLRIYAERPGAFAGRVRSYYEAWLAG
jgi:CHAD domain-containing protein